MLVSSFKLEYIRVDVGPNDDLYYGGQHRKATEWNSQGIFTALEDDPSAIEFISYRDLYNALQSGSAKISYDYHSVGETKIRLHYGQKTLERFGIRKARAARRMRYFVQRLEEILPLRLGIWPSDKELTNLLAIWNADYNQVLAGHGEADDDGRVRHHSHVTEVVQYVNPPCVRTFKDKYKEFMRCDRNILVFVRKPQSNNKRQKTISAESLALWKEFAFKYASPKRPKELHLLEELVSEIRLRNKERKCAPEPLPLLDTPGRKAFNKIVKSMDAWWVYARRWGFGAAVKEYRAQLSGADVWIPGQRIEFDDYMLHIQTLLRVIKVWDLLPERVKVVLETRRLWLTVGVDAATRYLTAVVPSINPNADAVINALNMSLSDKSDIALRVGARMPWLGGVRWSTALSDNGAPYIADKTEDAFRNAKIALHHPPKGQPWHRAFVESLLNRFGNEILSQFEGQTFVNTVVKGEYNAERQANLLIEELIALIIRWLIDVYHQEPVVATGETPHNAWARYIQENRVRFAPTDHERREYFGMDFVAKIHPEGTFYNGIRYNSLALNRHRQIVGNASVRFRILNDDIQYVSALIGDEWVPVRNKSGINQRTSMVEWCDIRRRFRALKKARADENWEVIALARREIRAAADSAANRAKFTPDAEKPASLRALIRQIGEGHDNEGELIEAALKYGLTAEERRQFADYIEQNPDAEIFEPLASVEAVAVEVAPALPIDTRPLEPRATREEIVAAEAQANARGATLFIEEDDDGDNGRGSW